MSLINDALKRAREAQAHAVTPPQPGPHFRPVEPSQEVRHSVGLLLPVGFTLVALCGLFLVWRRAQEQHLAAVPAVTPVAAVARPAQPSPRTPALQTKSGSPEPAGSQTASPATAAEPSAVPSPTAVSPPAAPAPAPTPAARPLAPVSAPPTTVSETNLSAGAEPAPPKPAPLKLQGIVFSPTRPSAMVNGKTLFVGDRIRDFRVTAITQNTATLVGAGQTNVLSLSE